MRALPLLLARLSRQQTFDWYPLPLCPTGSRQAWGGRYQGMHSVLGIHAALLLASKALSRWARLSSQCGCSGRPSCHFRPALEYKVSLEAGRGKNQCTQHEFCVHLSCVPG